MNQTAPDLAQLTPLQIFLSFVLLAVFLSVLFGCVVSWALWFGGVRPKKVATRPLATVGFIDILLTFVLMVLLFGIAGSIWRAINGPQREKPTPVVVSTDADAAQSTTDSSSESESKEANLESDKPRFTEKQFLFSGFAITAQLLGVLCVSTFVVARTGCLFSSIGWRRDQLVEDLVAGLQCFLMVTPPVLLMNMALVKWTDIPYDHPIQKMLENYPWLLGVAFWQACIVAPISEEFAFRTLLIGWFESIHFGWNKAIAFLFGVQSPKDRLKTIGEIGFQSGPDRALKGEGQEEIRTPTENPYSPETETTSEIAKPTESLEYKAPWWPAIVSGILFGVAHASYGVSWVNLSILGIVLGRLYQRRQSLVPVILVHFLFNSLSILMFGIKLAMPDSWGE